MLPIHVQRTNTLTHWYTIDKIGFLWYNLFSLYNLLNYLLNILLN